MTKTLNQHLDTAEKLSKALSTKEGGNTSQLKEMTFQVKELAKQVSRLTEQADQHRQGLLRWVSGHALAVEMLLYYIFVTFSFIHTGVSWTRCIV